MSKIGRKPIFLPEDVRIETNHKIVVKGPLGELFVKLPGGIKVKMEDKKLLIVPRDETSETKSFHGLTRSLIANMIEGVTKGFKKTLELSGIGFRAHLSGGKLVLAVGFSHPVEIEAPEGVSFAVTENKITVSGVDKELVGQVTAQIRNIRPPDPYKGKGIRYEGEIVRLKPGKAAKVGTGVGA
ncbi:MAG: 50S ribosomal protein L6 [Candidatus Woykebacteria bacterium GWB1_45_5]|uniref:Large ribosomal subunit protein uL6 n=2 Tax=Candidatus Woykeibacteriota TaxID=1817899 RepID=A0A1G1W2K6_9BACT|nr:MAG: 50S ribosomal protein L6 [Candidatus Woykebacteria bacterium GWA1_44_8]OGY23318.1 MAG: 50S ribosomal protein L6 [Candidatus Woykebacteria bacterium GWB1_45_5]